MITREGLKAVANAASALRHELTAILPRGADVDVMVAAAIPVFLHEATTPSTTSMQVITGEAGEARTRPPG